jgi:hypothetical protein
VLLLVGVPRAGGLAIPLDDVDIFGTAVAHLGDIDGNGVADIAVGASGDDDGFLGAGAVYILFLNSDGTVKAEQKISETEGGLAKDTPEERPVQAKEIGPVFAEPILGGLHHRYSREAA